MLRSIVENPLPPVDLQAEVNLDSINSVSNERLASVLARTSATPEQVVETVRVNTEARLRALKIGLLVMAGLSLLAVIPSRRLPRYRPGDIPGNPPPLRPGVMRPASSDPGLNV